MGGKRSPIRSAGPRWRPGRYKSRRSARVRKVTPFRPVRDTLIALLASFVAAVVIVCLAVPLAGIYGVPVFLSFASIMGAITGLSWRFGGKGPADRVMIGALVVVCVLVSGALFVVRDELDVRPHTHGRVAASAGEPARSR